MKALYCPLRQFVRGKWTTVSRLYQPLDMIPQSDVEASRKVKKIDEISSKSARLLQGLSHVRPSVAELFHLTALGLPIVGGRATAIHFKNSVSKLIKFN